MFGSLTSSLTNSGQMDLGDNSSANVGDISFGGSYSNAGTVTDKSWLLNAGKTDSSKVAYYAGMAAAGVVVLGVIVWAIKGRK